MDLVNRMRRALDKIRESFARRSVEQSLSTTRVFGVTNEIARDEISARPYIHGDVARSRSAKGEEDFIISRTSYFAVYYGNASRTRNAAA